MNSPEEIYVEHAVAAGRSITDGHAEIESRVETNWRQRSPTLSVHGIKSAVQARVPRYYEPVLGADGLPRRQVEAVVLDTLLNLANAHLKAS